MGMTTSHMLNQMLSGNTSKKLTLYLNVKEINMNAKKEIISHTCRVNSAIKCATINQIDSRTYKIIRVVNLFENYSPKDWDKFLNELDFDYNDGYGIQILSGTIWYNNGTWSSRQEYDGQEWWELNKCPSISFFSVENIDHISKPDEFTHWDGDESDRISY
jgi:hypothetical protein